MTYARSLGKALDVFDLDHLKWPELAADRSAWRGMLASGQPPTAFRAPPLQPAAPPLALGRARRSSAARTDAAIAASACDDTLTTTRLRPAARRAARHHQPRLIGRRLAAAACLRSDEEGWLSSLQTLSFFGSRCTTRRESVLCALLVPSVGVQ